MRNVIWSILLLTLLCGVASAATLSVEPGEITCFSEDKVNLTVVVRDVNNLGGFDFDVRWNAAVLEYDNVTPESYVNVSMVNANSAGSGRIRVAGVSTDGITTSGDAGVVLFTVRFVGRGESGSSSPVNLVVNNYGFLNSTSGEEIPVSKVTNATVKMKGFNRVDARVATPSNRAIVGVENRVIASVVNQQGVKTEDLHVEVVIKNETTTLKSETFEDTLPPWGGSQKDIKWTPEVPGTYTATINVTNLTDVKLEGKTSDTKTIIVRDYTLGFQTNIYGPWDGRASVGSRFYMYSYVNASQSGNVWFNITAPEHVTVSGGRNQTRYLYGDGWDYLSVCMWSEKPGKIAAGDIKFEIAANGKTASSNAPEVVIWVPSIRVSSVNATSVTQDRDGELTFNTLHTNNTYDNVTKIVVQSGARGRTLSGLEYLVGYPYGCVEQTTSKMLASLNVKNYYLNREKPINWDSIRNSVNTSVEGGVQKLVRGGEVGQNRDGGWSLWGGDPSESSSSSYASYTLARINDPEEDLSRLLDGRVSNGDTVRPGTVNFEKLIEWFHDNPDNPGSGTWTWSAHVCHSWSPESNTAFVMLIHDMINQTVDVQEPYRGYMEDNMRNATRYFVDTGCPWGSGDDTAMATALALWGLEEFAMTSDDVDETMIEEAKEAAKVWLIENQNDDGSWSAGYYYGWYDNGRKTESTAYAIIALNATGIPADDNMTIQKGVNWLINQYESGGGWGYTWATQAAIDALIQCQPTVFSSGTVDVSIDGEFIASFTVDGSSNPRVEYSLTQDEMNTLMDGGSKVRDIFGDGFSTVKSHKLTATTDATGGPILVSVDHSQSAPIREIDGTIQGSRMIQSFDYEEEAGLLQISTDIGILDDAPLMQNEGNTYTVGISSDQMVAGEEAEVTINVVSQENVYSPMIEIPIAGFTFDNTSVITENGEDCAFEVLNGTAGDVDTSLFIQSVGWVKYSNNHDNYEYKFNITPKDHGTLDLDLRIRPLYDETNVYLDNKTFDVLGRGNVTVNVVDEEGNATNAADIVLVEVDDRVSGKSTHTFTSILEGNYTLVVNGTNNYPSIRTAVCVMPDATALCNVTLPSSLIAPTLVFSEGGAGSIASVEWVPPGRLSADYPENTTYNITVLGDGGKLGIALEFPMRYLMNTPVVKVNGEETEDYEIINGTFEYVQSSQTYSTTNATLIVYNTTAGSNTIEIGFEGGLLGDVIRDDWIDLWDALAILDYGVGNYGAVEFMEFGSYDYPDVNRDGYVDLWDALGILDYGVGNVDQYYEWK